MRSILRVLCSGFLLAALPAAARAQSHWVSPFIGATLGGDTTHKSQAVGVSGGWMFSKWLGVEGELADAPELFDQTGFLTNRRVTTVMGNAVFAAPHGKDNRMVPYLSGGLGLLRPHLTEAGEIFDVKVNKLGWDLGGGAAVFMNKNVGVRGDLRYFRGARHSVEDTNAFDVDFSSFGFWRVSAGLAVRF
jgi:opacity protein-like surface antigen